jgi:quinol monooxygenase YgiN
MTEVRLLIMADLKVSAAEAATGFAAIAEDVLATEPGVLCYVLRVDSDGVRAVVEETYRDLPTFAAHMDKLRENGGLRQVGRMLRANEVLILDGDAERVATLLGPLKTVGLGRIAGR